MIHDLTAMPRVFHGASGLPAVMVRRAIELGVCKLNVDTELRVAYFGALKIVLMEGSPLSP